MGKLYLRDKEECERFTNGDEIMIGRIKRCAMDGQKYLLSQPLVAHSLIVIFGISAWIGINGIYVQLPLLVISAPEGWNLAAYTVVMIQAANVGPATYTLARKFFPPLDESFCIFGLLFVGSVAMGLLAFLYDETFYVGSERHSVAMFTCVFLSALVGCTSSVLFMPYLRNTSNGYLVSYFIGEGLSGVVPSVVAFFQGVGGNPECRDYENGTREEITFDPRFSPRDYFIFLFGILLLSLCTFGLLRYLPSIEEDASKRVDNCQFNSKREIELEQGNFHSVDNTSQSNSFDNSAKVKFSNNEEITLSRTIYLHVLVAIICFLGNGFLPGIQTYSCLPYGNVAFHLTVTLANVANPIACLLFFWIDSINLMILDVLSILGMTTCTFAIYLAAVSPNPPLRDSSFGVAMVVVIWIILTGVISCLKLTITSKIRQKLGPKALIGVGIVMQFGSACGAILSFGFINYTTVFKQHKSCPPL